MGNPHIEVYWREDLPDRWWFKNNKTIAPLIVVADKGWLIVDVRSTSARSRSSASIVYLHSCFTINKAHKEDGCYYHQGRWHADKKSTFLEYF